MNEKKLKQLAGIEGYQDDIYKMLEDATFDRFDFGICRNDGCDYTTRIEPDQDEGWCGACETNTVASALVLGDLI